MWELHRRFHFIKHVQCATRSIGNWSRISTGLAWTTASAGYATIITNTNSAANAQGLLVKSTGVVAANRVLTLNANGSDLLVAQKNGNVGIGTASPGYKLDVQGGGVNASGVYTNVSDMRLKRNRATRKLA